VFNNLRRSRPHVAQKGYPSGDLCLRNARRLLVFIESIAGN